MTREALRIIAITLALAAALVAYSAAAPYDCTTDAECEAAEAARCLIFCER